MSDLFSQFVSLVTPKYAKVNLEEAELHHDNAMQKNHFRATMSAEDRAKFFPEVSTTDNRSTTRTPPPRPPAPVVKSDNLWDVDLDDDEEIDEQVLKTQVLNETVDETKRNDKFITDKPIESDNLVVQTEKTRPQIGDLFPSINEILNDHGIKEKFRDITMTVRNKLQKDEPSTEDSQETKESTSIFSGISLPQPPAFLSRNSGSAKLYPMQQSKDKTVQTYFPGH